MDRMKRDLKDGETYLYANSPEEYARFTDWLCANGGKFAYHFEVGEGYWHKERIVEVYGL
jgi:hypothetical protein